MKFEPRNCTECFFSKKEHAPPPSIETFHVCRVNPPTPIAIPTPNGLAIASQHPVVTAASGCAKWTPEPPEAPAILS